MERHEQIERILWSIAFPGFGQIINGHLIKGIWFIALEFLINSKANLNMVIISSFMGNTGLAVKQANYEWLMFYPCIYMYAIWDAYRGTAGEKPTFSFLPFVCSAFFGTVGVIYSSTFRIKGVLLGPIWLPILCFILGIIIGLIARLYLSKYATIFK